MNTPLDLQLSLSELLGDARLVITDLPETSLKLWLIDARNMDRAFTPDETR
ncbi:methyltransferase, partial [Pseudomonas psychrophila]